MARSRAQGFVALAAWMTAACSEAPPSSAPSVDAPDGGKPDVEQPVPACPAGELELPDGSCREAGIDADECGTGFVSDGDRGCEPVLPRDACGPGTMAVLGETTCREIAPCGEGKWGDIPVDAETQYVDATYTGTDSDGSADKPWPTVQQAVGAAAAGAIVAIAPGSYVEHVLIQGKPVRLWGKCPAEVEIVGPPSSTFAIDVRSADGTEVRDLAATGSGVGVAFAGSENAVADRVWIHDTTGPGFMTQDFGGVTSAALKRSLVEAAGDLGVYCAGATIAIEDSVLRDTKPTIAGEFGRGINAVVSLPTGRPSEVAVRRSLLERHHEGAISIFGSTVLVEDSLLRDSKPSAKYENSGTGLDIQPQTETGDRASAIVRRSVITNTRRCGICAFDSDLDVETTVVRDVLPEGVDQNGGSGVIAIDQVLVPEGQSVVAMRRSLVERTHFFGAAGAGVDAAFESLLVRDIEPQVSDGLAGRGIGIEPNSFVDPPIPGKGVVRGCRVERAHEAGLMVVGSAATLESVAISDIQPRPDGLYGRGISVEVDPPSGASSTATLANVLVEHTTEFGVFVVGSQATIDGLVVRDTKRRPADGTLGIGLGLQFSFENGAPTTAAVRHATVEQSFVIGVWIAGAVVDLADVTVRDTRPLEDGSYGDGVLVSAAQWDLVTIPTKATLTSVHVESSSRAGVSNFASEVSIGDSNLFCNPIHLDGEAHFGMPFVFSNLGGNECACDGEQADCVVLSTSLTAPEPMGK